MRQYDSRSSTPHTIGNGNSPLFLVDAVGICLGCVYPMVSRRASLPYARGGIPRAGQSMGVIADSRDGDIDLAAAVSSSS